MSKLTFPKTDVTIIDQQDKFEEDKDIKVSLRYSTDTSSFTASTPISKKRDTSSNIPIFASEAISLTVRVHKDGRLGPSGKITRKSVIELGPSAVKTEFRKAAEAIIQHFK